MIIPPFLTVAPLKTCFCSENVTVEKPEFQKGISTMDDEMYFDMESRGIEFVASKWKYPRLIMKVPLDLVGENGDLNRKNFKELSEKISQILKSLPYHDYLEKIVWWIE